MSTPIKLREAVLRARAEGRTYEEIAALLGIGRATVNRLLRLHRETSSLEPRPRGGGNFSPIHGALADLLVAIVGEMPDATVAELAAAFEARSGTETSRSGVQRALLRLGFSRKKELRRCRAGHAGAPSALRRVLRVPPQRGPEPPRFHRRVLREDGDASRVRPLPSGRARPGTRPCRSWKTISLIGAIRLGERPKIMTSRSAVDGRTFLRFVKRRLAPWIYPGDIVILDNLGIHKMHVVREAILDAGGISLYLPTYSPELNPIERLWADI